MSGDADTPDLLSAASASVPPRSPRPSTEAGGAPRVPVLNLEAVHAANAATRTPRTRSGRRASDADVAAVSDPFETAYDLLSAGLTSTSDAVVALRARQNDGAVLLGAPSCGVLLRSPPYPQWLHTWIPPQTTMLCYNMTGALALGVLCRGLIGAKHAAALDAAAAIVDTVMRPPSHCALTVNVWRDVGARLGVVVVFDHLDRIGAVPVPPCPAAMPGVPDPPYLAMLRAAGHLAQAQPDAAAAALALPEAYVRTLVQTPLPLGAKHEVTVVSPRAPGAAPIDEATAARYRVAGALMYIMAVDEAMVAINAALPHSDEALPADVELVLAPRPRESPLASGARQMCNYLFAESERQLLAANCVPAQPPPRLALDDTMRGERAALVDELAESVSDLLAAAFEERQWVLPAITEALLRRRAKLTVNRLPAEGRYQFSFTAVLRDRVSQMAEAIEAVDCVAVQCRGDSSDSTVLNEAAVGEALTRCAAAYPRRLTLVQFERLYAPLIQDQCGRMPVADAVRRVCQSVAARPQQYCVAGNVVCLDNAVHEALLAHTARLQPQYTRLVDDLALEHERLRAAFPEEYGWLDMIAARAMPPHLHTTTPRPASAAPADYLHLIGQFVWAVARNVPPPTAAAGVPWCSVLCARVWRARGWRDLGAAADAVRLVAANLADLALQRAMALARIADACAVAYAFAQPLSTDAQLCEDALRSALRECGLACAEPLNRICALTPNMLPQTLRATLEPCFKDTVALRPSVAMAACADVAVTQCANRYAAAAESKRIEPLDMLVALARPEAATFGRLRAVAQCLASPTLSAADVALPAGMRIEWATTGGGAPYTLPSIAGAVQLVNGTFDRHRFAEMCALPATDAAAFLQTK